MIAFILWYITTTILGFLAFPLAYRLFSGLADRGYAFSRIIGLLLWGYIFWLLASLGLLRNESGGLLLAAGIMVLLVYLVFKNMGSEEIRDWIKDNLRLVLGVELLFLVAFAGWAFVRSTNPEILGTEKPMELAFINAILRSRTFPPHDPWLSGYAISYYYFGYVLVAMLAKITATPGSIAFNLAVALVFSLTACGAYGLIYSLLGRLRQFNHHSKDGLRDYIAPLMGSAYILIISNLEGFLEVLHARGLFWRRDLSGNLISGFWTWLDMRELSQPPAEPLSWVPTRYLWWWRASRVVQDYDLVGNWKEIIDEFPFFSYLLADLHPHVLAMPFALLAIGLAMNLLFGGFRGVFRIFGFRLRISPIGFWCAALVMGGLAFLNTWDFPIYVFLFSCAYILLVARDNCEGGGTDKASGIEHYSDYQGSCIWRLARDFITLALPLGFLSIVLYLPFYLGFSSQAGGILPNLINPTRGAHLWVMFGALLGPIFAYLIFLWTILRKEVVVKRGLNLAIGTVAGFLTVSFFFGAILASLPFIGNLYVGSLGAEVPLSHLFSVAIDRRISNLGWVTLVILIGFTAGIPWVKKIDYNHGELVKDKTPQRSHVHAVIIENHGLSPAHRFVLLLIATGTLLVLFTDFFYLRDQFGWRMNTIFKFYYQTWLMWGLAAAFSTVFLWNSVINRWRYILRFGMLFLLTLALVYPILSLWNKTNGFNPAGGFTLDGAAYLSRQAPDDMAGVEWLKNAPAGIVLEAVGSSYSEFARVSTHSGQPTLLGWPGHESQWRGGGAEMGNRSQDIEFIYRSNDWDRVRELLEYYDIRYVYVGPLERRSYRVEETKFQRHLETAFQSGQVTIYRVPMEIDPPGRR